MKFLPRRSPADATKAEWLDVLSRHAGVGLWDALLHEGDATHPRARWTWSGEFRRLCGYETEADFPNVMQSWSDRLHPDDAASTFAAFGAALKAGSGYDVTYRLKVRSGDWRWFRATGGVVLGADGVPRRACGSLVDVHDAYQAEADQSQARDRLAASFETDVLQVVSGLVSDTERVERDAGRLHEAAGQASRCSVGAARASDEMRGRVQNVAGATEEITASMREISRQVAISTQSSDAAAVQARDTTRVVSGLVEDVRRIGDVVKLISDIAGQTNLLALNATIEAARAGEAGKGFAVVASEVKTLANQTARATEEITSHIGTVQKATHGVAQAIEGMVDTINHLSQVAAAIAAAVQQQGSATAGIARDIQQVAHGTQEIADTIGEMNQLAESTGEASGQISDSASGLSKQAHELSRQVSGFLTELRAA